jgi:hypothetical protein
MADGELFGVATGIGLEDGTGGDVDSFDFHTFSIAWFGSEVKGANRTRWYG